MVARALVSSFPAFKWGERRFSASRPIAVPFALRLPRH